MRETRSTLCDNKIKQTENYSVAQPYKGRADIEKSFTATPLAHALIDERAGKQRSDVER